MKFAIVFLVWVGITILLFRLDRDRSVRVSKALWLPTLLLLIVGSRPVSGWLNVWFGIGASLADKGNLDAQLDGSPLDAMVFGLLLLIGLGVLWRRSARTRSLLVASAPILIYYFYCLVSTSWSPIPLVALKRWIKDICDLVMVLIIATEVNPLASLERLFARVGFILFPWSIFMIRYTGLGRGFDADGNPENVGVTTNKNTLGLITYFITLGAVWSLLRVLRSKPHRGRAGRIVARVALVAFGLSVLYQAHSATSVACFILGAAVIFIADRRVLRRRPKLIHAVMSTVLLFGGTMLLFGGAGIVVHALGRKTDLTGRTDIWKAVIPLCPNPVIGAGFESFWNGFGRDIQGLSAIESRNLATAHNGYIEIYLNLGLIGVALILFLLISAYRNATAAYCKDREMGGLMLAYMCTAAIYSVAEAGFRILTPSWISLLLAIVGSNAAFLPRLGRKPSAIPIDVKQPADPTEIRRTGFATAQRLDSGSPGRY